MSFSEIPKAPELVPGCDAPHIAVRPPGPQSRTWLTRLQRSTAPMGRRADSGIRTAVHADVPANTVVFSTAFGSNITDVDGNRYVDLAAGFGAMLLGHRHPTHERVMSLQTERLSQALGDVYPSDAKIALCERLSALAAPVLGGKGAQCILGLSGSDAITAALKTAVLATGRSGVIAFEGAYHGLSYGPLSACGLRSSYRVPFAGAENRNVSFASYPVSPEQVTASLRAIEEQLQTGFVGAVLYEPILGRGGCVVPPEGFGAALGELVHAHGALLIADEIWTGLGRSGSMFLSAEQECSADLLCLGKGLGGGLPISACLGSPALMSHWSQEDEVVHTSTFSGSPLAAAGAISCLDVLSRQKLVDRSARIGAWLMDQLQALAEEFPVIREVRGRGLMIGLDLGSASATRLMQSLLVRGYLTTTGGGGREVLIVTPPLVIDESQLEGWLDALRFSLVQFSS